jgi:hypothetical protein
MSQIALLSNARRYLDSKAALQVNDLIPVDPPLPLTAFDNAIRETMSTFKAGDAQSDGFLAPRVHAALPISRRQAADLRLWHWLTVLHCRTYVDYRWGQGTNPPNEERLLGGLNRNAFSRLWWITELTSDPKVSEPYRLTAVAFSLQEFTVALFDRSFMQYRPAMVACLETLQGQNGDVAQATGLQLNSVLSTLVLEALSEVQIRELVGQMVKETQPSAAPKK